MPVSTMARARTAEKAGRGFFCTNRKPFKTPADESPVRLDDPEILRHLRGVAARWGRACPSLAPDFESEVNAALFEASLRWRPGRGMSAKSYVLTLANARCSQVVQQAIPLGYRYSEAPGEPPSTRTAKGSILAATIADRSEPVGEALERSELVAQALEAFGPYAPAYRRWVTGEAQLADLAAEEGVTRQAIQQRFMRALERVRQQMGEDTPADPSSPAPTN